MINRYSIYSLIILYALYIYLYGARIISACVIAAAVSILGACYVAADPLQVINRGYNIACAWACLAAVVRVV